MLMDKGLEKLLEEVGFTSKEAKVYLALLELNKGNVKEIARITQLKRPIIYVILEGLVTRGYASESLETKVNIYQPTDPSVILNKLRNNYKNFHEMLPIFRSLGNRGKKRPKITYHETKEGIASIWEDMNNFQDVFLISSYRRIEDHFPGLLDKWLHEMKKGIINPGFRQLISDSPFEIEFAKKFMFTKNQRARFLPELRNSHMDFAIFGNKLAITSLGEDPFIVAIESEELVHSIKPLFELAWKNGERIT